MNNLITALKHKNITNAQRVAITEQIDHGYGVFSITAWNTYTEVDFRPVNNPLRSYLIAYNLEGIAFDVTEVQ